MVCANDKNSGLRYSSSALENTYVNTESRINRFITPSLVFFNVLLFKLL